MNEIYSERAVLEAIGWVVPTLLGALVVALKGPRRWLASVPRLIKQAAAERRADKSLHSAMARDWPRFSADITRSVAELREASSLANRKMHAIRDDVLTKIGGVSKVLGTLLAMTLSDFDTAPEPRFLCDAEGRITHVNSALATALGIDRDVMMGWRWRGRVPAEILGPFLERFAAANAGHYQLDDEIAFRDRERRLLRFRILLMPFPPDDGPATHWAAKLTPLGGDA